MTTPAITVVLPVLTARMARARQTIAAYQATTPNLQLRVEHNTATCGEAWDKGAQGYQGDYIHFGADDLEPHDGWWQPLVEAVERGLNPCPLVLEPDGAIQSCGADGWDLLTHIQPDWASVGWSTVPFMSREHWALVGYIPRDMHYATDTWVSARLLEHGIETVVRTGSVFTHHNAMAGRGAGMDIHERNRLDRSRFAQLLS